MFSMVRNIASAFKPYEAEAADARLQKEEQKSDFGGNDDSLDGNRHSEFPENDVSAEISSLSVKSIILFLEDYVESKLEANTQDSRLIDHDENFAPWFRTKQSNDVQAVPSDNAIKAYVQASKTSAAPIGPISQARASDIREAYALIHLLRSLEEQGVRYLKVDGHASFIDAVSQAATKNLNS